MPHVTDTEGGADDVVTDPSEIDISDPSETEDTGPTDLDPETTGVLDDSDDDSGGGGSSGGSYTPPSDTEGGADDVVTDPSEIDISDPSEIDSGTSSSSTTSGSSTSTTSGDSELDVESGPAGMSDPGGQRVRDRDRSPPTPPDDVPEELSERRRRAIIERIQRDPETSGFDPDEDIERTFAGGFVANVETDAGVVETRRYAFDEAAETAFSERQRDAYATTIEERTNLERGEDFVVSQDDGGLDVELTGAGEDQLQAEADAQEAFGVSVGAGGREQNPYPRPEPGPSADAEGSLEVRPTEVRRIEEPGPSADAEGSLEVRPTARPDRGPTDLDPETTGVLDENSEIVARATRSRSTLGRAKSLAFGLVESERKLRNQNISGGPVFTIQSEFKNRAGETIENRLPYDVSIVPTPSSAASLAAGVGPRIAKAGIFTAAFEGSRAGLANVALTYGGRTPAENQFFDVVGGVANRLIESERELAAQDLTGGPALTLQSEGSPLPVDVPLLPSVVPATAARTAGGVVATGGGGGGIGFARGYATRTGGGGGIVDLTRYAAGGAAASAVLRDEEVPVPSRGDSPYLPTDIPPRQGPESVAPSEVPVVEGGDPVAPSEIGTPAGNQPVAPAELTVPESGRPSSQVIQAQTIIQRQGPLEETGRGTDRFRRRRPGADRDELDEILRGPGEVVIDDGGEVVIVDEPRNFPTGEGAVVGRSPTEPGTGEEPIDPFEEPSLPTEPTGSVVGQVPVSGSEALIPGAVARTREAQALGVTPSLMGAFDRIAIAQGTGLGTFDGLRPASATTPATTPASITGMGFSEATNLLQGFSTGRGVATTPGFPNETPPTNETIYPPETPPGLVPGSPPTGPPGTPTRLRPFFDDDDLVDEGGPRRSGPGGGPSGGEAPLASGYFSETVTDLALGGSLRETPRKTQSLLAGALEELGGAPAGEIPTTEAIAGTPSERRRIAETAALLGGAGLGIGIASGDGFGDLDLDLDLGGIEV